MVTVGALALCGCALDPTYNFDNSTIFKGKQAWESKPHADDWIVPGGDAVILLCVSALEESVECTIGDALTQASEPRWLLKREREAGARQ